MSTELNYNYELGRLYFKQGDFLNAEPKLEKACRGFFETKDFDRYSESLNYLLRIFAERDDFTRIQEEKERLQDLVVRENISLKPMTLYTLGLCSAYRDGQEGTAIEYFNKALQLALQSDNKIEMCYAIYGLAVTYYNVEQYENALKELQHLEVFFGVVSIPDIEISSRLLHANIYRNRGNFERALELYWKCYELLKIHRNMFLYMYALYGVGSTHQRAGEKQMARMYLELALRSVDEKQYPRLTNRILKHLSGLGDKDSFGDYDLVLETKTNSVVERARGRVDFKNQFILLDLLNLFVKNPGKVFAKDALVRRVWNQEYDPSIHDNKIYVTIKRLRKMIEPDFDKPKYIFRAKNGYYLNKNIRIHLQ